MSDKVLPASLNAKERKRFLECKRIVLDGLKSCWNVGEALTEIRDERYYREDYASFDEFCQAEYQIGKSYAHRLIEAVEIKQDIAERSPQTAKLLTNERQARELANVPRETQVKVIKELAREELPITAENIREKAESILEQTAGTTTPKVSPVGDTRQNVPVEKSPTIQVDEEGFPLTETAKRAWSYRDKVQGWLSTLSAIKSEIIALKDDPQFVRQQQQIVANLSSSYSTLSDCKAYAVCTECDGFPDTQAGKVCGMCGRTGAISKYAWGLQSRSSVKETRSKIAARQRV